TGYGADVSAVPVGAVVRLSARNYPRAARNQQLGEDRARWCAPRRVNTRRVCSERKVELMAVLEAPVAPSPSSPETGAPSRQRRLWRPNADRWLLVLSVATGALTHGYNLFNYPLYITDEGIYLQQAWSVLRESRLSPYTYFYDHAPAGWLVIAGWVS